MAYIQMKHSYKRYKTGDLEIIANNDVSFDIEKGELVVILGASGAGKSTVLNILGGMDTNDEGRVIIDGKDISEYTAKELTTYRREDVGFVFQFYNLVSNLTARENVELASEIVPNAKDATHHNYLVGSNSVLPLHAPLPKIQRSFFVMNQQGLWIIKQGNKSWPSFKKWLANREQLLLSWPIMLL